jgi:hypothetical protein
MTGAVIFLMATLIGDLGNGLAALGLLVVGLIGRAVLARQSTSS